MCICSLFDFRKLRIFRCFPFPENSGTPTFPISGNSGLRRFPIFLYYVITLISCLHLSLVTPSAVVNTSLSPDPQFPLALLYCFRLYNSDPILCTRYNFIPFLSYKYLYSVARISRIKITTPTTIPIHLVRIRSTVLTQPGTLVSFRGMCICLLFDFRKLRKFPMFSISGKLRNSDVSDFRKLRTPTFSEIFVLCNHSLIMSSPFTGDSVHSR